MAWPELGYFCSIAIAITGVAAAALPGTGVELRRSRPGRSFPYHCPFSFPPRPAALVLKRRSMTRNTENGKKEVSLLFWGPRRRQEWDLGAGRAAPRRKRRTPAKFGGGRKRALASASFKRAHCIRQPRAAATRFSENAGPAAQAVRRSATLLRTA
jgi:hypothetical protein